MASILTSKTEIDRLPWTLVAIAALFLGAALLGARERKKEAQNSKQIATHHPELLREGSSQNNARRIGARINSDSLQSLHGFDSELSARTD